MKSTSSQHGPPLGIDVRRVTSDEYRDASDVMRIALMSSPSTESDWSGPLPHWDNADSLCAWEGRDCVGIVGAFRFDTTVPGGARLGTAGVTRVGVLPTHTRRGILRSMLTALLRDRRGDGAVLASLRASEHGIYERFGFGVAAESVAMCLDVGRAGGVRTRSPGSMTMVRPSEAVDVVEDLYERFGRARVGSISRERWLTERIICDAHPDLAPGASVVRGPRAVHVAVHRQPDGVVDGYVAYELGWDEASDEVPLPAVGTVIDVFGETAGVERALWGYLLDIDLVRAWRSSGRPLDDAGRLALANPRAYRVTSHYDEQWLRILDVERALRSRSYGPAPGSVVVEVDDPLFEDNCGRWRVSVDGVEATTTVPDVTASIAALSAAYLGGTSWVDLVLAGLVDSPSHRILNALDVLFASRPLPFCGTFF